MEKLSSFLNEISDEMLGRAASSAMSRGETKRAERFVKHMTPVEDTEHPLDCLVKNNNSYKFNATILSSPLSVDYRGTMRCAQRDAFKGWVFSNKSKTVGFVENDRFFESIIGDFEFDNKIPCDCEYHIQDESIEDITDDTTVLKVILTLTTKKDTFARVLEKQGPKDIKCPAGSKFESVIGVQYSEGEFEFNDDAFKSNGGIFSKALEEYIESFDLDANEGVNEGYLADKTIRAAQKVVRILFGEAEVDEQMLDITDEADEVEFRNGAMELYFKDAEKAMQTFNDFANLIGADINGEKFDGGPITGEIMDFNWRRPLASIKEGLLYEGIFDRIFGKSFDELIKEGFVKIDETDALAIMNGLKIQRHLYTLKERRDEKGNSIWLKGPGYDTDVFDTYEQAFMTYNLSNWILEETPQNMADYTFEDFEANGGKLLWTKDGRRDVNSWHCWAAKIRGVQY